MTSLYMSTGEKKTGEEKPKTLASAVPSASPRALDLACPFLECLFEVLLTLSSGYASSALWRALWAWPLPVSGSAPRYPQRVLRCSLPDLRPHSEHAG